MGYGLSLTYNLSPMTYYLLKPYAPGPMLHALEIGLGFAYQKFPKHLICLRQE
jgi:hypothetical protein